jgi:hypothetical protein
VRCHYTITAATRPGEILAVLNVRDRKLMDVWRIDLRTGGAALDVEDPGDVAWRVADDNLVIRGAGTARQKEASKCAYAPQTTRDGGRSYEPRRTNGYSPSTSARTVAKSFCCPRSEATPSAW